MPPTRRRGGATAARPNQATLSFGSKSRVTKPSRSTQTQKTKDLEPITASFPDKSVEPEQATVTSAEPSQPHVAELAVRQQAQAEIQQPLSEEDERAIKITERDLQQYWRKEEGKRRGPRGSCSADAPGLSFTFLNQTLTIYRHSSPGRSHNA
jgi:DNA polymerase delta subunit 4